MKKTKTNIELIRAKNLINYIEPRYKTIIQFAEAIEKAYPQVHAMLFDNNKSFGDKIARYIEAKLELSSGYLDTPEPEKPPLNIVMLPLYTSKLSAGSNISSETQIGEIPFSLTEIQKSNIKLENLISIIVEGSGMQYTINEGSIAIIDVSQTEIVDNKIYAFNVGKQGAITIKRLCLGVEGIIVQSDNKEFPEEKVLYNSKLKLEIIGRVLWVINKLL
ncbi:MAG: putative phage repressor [Burkholderiales bacterium]|jgi:hypothetical protein|nr:putative phage repressor [Burkholderiales bacterium]